MAAPTFDFINQAQDELIAVLSASAEFKALVKTIEGDLPETDRIPTPKLPHCGVIYLDDEPAWEDSAASDTDYRITLGLRFYHRGTDRQAVWEKLKKAAALVAKIVAYENSPFGSSFNGFAVLGRYEGGTAIDTKEESGFGALLLVRVSLQITLPDYEDTP